MSLHLFAGLRVPDFQTARRWSRSSSTISMPAVAAIAGRGLEPGDIEIYSNGVRKMIYRDPDGNELSFGGPPLDPGSSA